MTERRKGPSRSNIESHAEDCFFGPYPSWDRWKPTLLRQIGEDNFDKFDPMVKELLHKSYVVHRKFQLNQSFDRELEEIRQLEIKLKGREKIHSDPKVDFALNFINSR